MKYLKYSVFICLVLSFVTEKVKGQNSNGDNVSSLLSGAVQPEPDTLEINNDSTDHLINIAYAKIDNRDKQGAISVLNPGEYINIDYNSGLSGRVGGLLGDNNIWNLGNALVMIDGVPRNFGDIRLDEIEQITVLKGVNAVALYGSHAADGVILITSKRGNANNREINVRLNTGLATPKLFPEYLGSAEYMTLYNEARVNDGSVVFYDEETINNFKNGNPYRYPDIDYYSSDYLSKYVNNTNMNAEFSGGNKDAKFYSNIGWMSNSTLLNIGEGAKEKDSRFNARGNVDLRINNFISSTIDVSAVIGNSRRGLVDYWNSAATILPNKYSPLLPINMIDQDSVKAVLLAQNSGNIINDQYILGGSQEYLTNPIADLYVGGYNNYISRVLQITNGIDINLNSVVKGLSFHTKFNADYYNSYNQSINNEYSVYSPTWDTVPGSYIITGLEKFGTDARPGTQNISGTAQTRNLGFSLYFNYLRTFNKVHNISAIILGSGTSISNNIIYQPSTNANLGLQLGYNFSHKYWVDFSGAVVNSTKLPQNSRTAFSPTIALSWLASAEDFLAGSNNVDLLKLSVSAGILNTDRVIGDYYLYDNTYTSQAWFSWDDDLYRNRSTTSLQGANPNLTFAKRKEFNATIEGSFFEKQLWLETTFFVTRFDDLLTQRFSQYPSYYATFVPYTNYNSNRGSGIDFMINFNKRVGELEFILGLNGVYANSKVIKRDEFYTNSYQSRVGKPVDAIFGLISDGFFMDETDIDNHPKQAFGEVRPGDIKYVDQNGDGVIDANDEVEIGRWISPFSYALNFTVSFKNITLFMQGTGSAGGNGVKTGDYYWVDGDNKYSVVVLDRWTEETKNTSTYPRLSSQQNNNNYRYSDFWIYKTDRFNLSRVQITYDLPKNILNKTFIKELGVYVNGANLFTFSKNKDIMDLNVWGAPQMRYFNAGIRANF